MQSAALRLPLETVFHVTVASNFARAYDKYAAVYDKAGIGQSTFSDQFFVLKRAELPIGIEKASKLLAKLALPGNRLVVLEAKLPLAALKPNLRTDRGRYIDGARLPLSGVHWVETTAEGAQLVTTCVEEVYALSLQTLNPVLPAFADLAPRTLSVLPIARACQAACKFCFSESSASLEQSARLADLETVGRWIGSAKAAGAERFVITGGGEPGLLRHDSMVDLMALASSHFGKVVLITNGVHLARRDAAERAQYLSDYVRAGLTVLAVSRHHAEADVNAAIMGLDTRTELVLESVREARAAGARLTSRLICVLQRGGVETAADIEAYLRWAAARGVDEVCFKELYVSSTLESAYHERPENAWAHEHQVPLARLTELMPRLGFDAVGTLPWGAPFFQGSLDGHPLRVAAYTEPSLYWERANGVARSWNVMADGSCLVSLEDPTSLLPAPAGSTSPGATTRRVIPLQAI